MVAEGPGRRIFVYPIENGKAEDLANVQARLWFTRPSRWWPKENFGDLHRSTQGYKSVWRRVSLAAEVSLGSRSGTSGTSSSGFGSQQPFGAYAAAQIPAPAGQPAAPVPQPAWSSRASWACSPGAAPRAPTPGAPGAPGAKPEEQLRIVADPATIR